MNDSEREIERMTQWIVDNLGPDVPIHFTAFHPDWKMMDVPPTPPATLTRARRTALRNGVRYAYTGNVRDVDGGTTGCHKCGRMLVARDGYDLKAWHLTDDGCCSRCGAPLAGVLTDLRADGAAGGFLCRSERNQGSDPHE